MSQDPLVSQDRCFSDLLEQRAKAHPGRTAYIAVGSDGAETVRLTYGELHRKVELYSAALTARRIGGSRALMLFEPGLAFVVAFLGCLRAGVVAIPANIAKPGRTSWDRLIAIVRDSGAACILTEQASTSKMSGWFSTAPDLSALDILCLEDSRDKPVASRDRPSQDTPAFLQYTSGSTGNPKGTVITFGNLAANAAITGPATGIDFDARVVTWLPPYHDLGLIGNILQTLWAGAECVLMPPVSFVQNPARWLETIDRYRATVSMAPNFAYELCVRRIPAARRREFELSSWKVAFNAAEPIRATAIHRFQEAYRDSGFKAQSMQTAYGLAEATLVVSAGDPQASPVTLTVDSHALDQGKLLLSTDPNRSREIVSSGFVRPPQKVRIVNPESFDSCAADEIGEIWVSGPCVASGYWGRDEETERTFRAHTADGDGPYLRTGDLGILYDSQLYVTGRIKEVIIVRGRKIYPQDIEATVQRAHDALRPAGGAAFAVETGEGESIVVVQEVERAMLATVNRQELVSLISEAVFLEHDLAIADVVLVKPEVVPKTSSGKIQRVLCRDLYSRGDLDLIVQGRSNRTNPLADKNVHPDVTRSDYRTEQAGASVPRSVSSPASASPATPATPAVVEEVVPVSVHSIAALLEAWLVANELKVPSEPRQTFAELGVDSIGVVELADFLQERLQVEIDHTVVYDYPTPDMLADFLFSKYFTPSSLPHEQLEQQGVDENQEIPGW
ncbi:AMP-binding protein [Burkholderia sp. WSM2232]|uniref:AMP-binding protein n=1 Tax=Burkholderia sp. WSM2232 TaxID=944436 RepID=UPI0006862432|nr:AMP-binding protein [Burkholderia sp. WSM2232]